MPPRSEIPRILQDGFARARLTYESAHEEWKAVSSDIPSGLPHPDGTQRIRNASKNYYATMDEYHRAIDEYNEFIRHGTVPERLKET
jgi:hypothetical protein